MDYYAIGQRIRRFRKAANLSQEQLAEQIGISVTHMSHIETGNTKLSLPVFVEIARVLSVQTDALLYDTPELNKTTAKQEISELLEKCTIKEVYILTDMVKSLKMSMDRYL